MHERIQIDPRICHGRPVIRNTRVMVATILGALGAGDTVEEVLANYPTITSDDIRAALSFGADLSRFEEIPYGTVA